MEISDGDLLIVLIDQDEPIGVFGRLEHLERFLREEYDASDTDLEELRETNRIPRLDLDITTAAFYVPREGTL